MALIECPQCGKQVSDTAELCVHCGAVLKEPPAPKNYAELPAAEKEALDLEFEREHPACSVRRAEKKKWRLTSLFFVALCLIMVGIIDLINSVRPLLVIIRFSSKSSVALYQGNEAILLVDEGVDDSLTSESNTGKFSLLFILSLLFIIIGVVMMVIAGVVYNKAQREVLLRRKLFQAWLAKRNICYEPMLSDKNKAKFDSLDITGYQI